MGIVSFMTANFGQYDKWSIEDYERIGGFRAIRKAVAMDAGEIPAILSACGIKGRGGAAYEMGKKWAQARAEKGPDKVVVCNADEGEPCTFKDRTLIQNDPFNLLEGLLIAGLVVKAQNGYIYLREEYSHLRPLLRNAISSMREHGYLGKNILGLEGFNYDIHLETGAGAYVCGEGTALVESIEGKSGRPRMKPPYIKQCGLYNLPTCVQNVESLSLVAHVLNDDIDIYKTYGTENSIGTKLVSVAGNVRKPGVFEITFGTKIRDIIYDYAGGIPEDRALRFIQFGGASGKIAGPEILDTPYTYEDLSRFTVTVGSGAILVVDERTSVLEFLRVTQEFFSHESCGQCAPCREGNRHIKEILSRMVDGTHTSEDIEKMRQLANVLRDTSLCGLGQAGQNALRRAFNRYPELFTAPARL